jgi:hypothetical protein
MTALQFFHDTCSAIPEARKGAMFGWECYKCGTRPFVFFDRNTDDAAAFKLSGEALAEAMALRGADIFNPGDQPKPMRNWVVVPYAHRERWAQWALLAFEGVLTEPAKPPKKNRR